MMYMEELIFDPTKGATVFEPPTDVLGSWVGAASVLFDRSSREFFLYYRLRTQEDRGFECRIARSNDGRTFKNIWSASKQAFEANSLERGALITVNETYRLYLGIEDESLHRWKVVMLEAQSPDQFNPDHKITVLRPRDDSIAHVKDPYIILEDQKIEMFVSYHPITGLTSQTGLATSSDGIRFHWEGEMFPLGKSWDSAIRRITSVVPFDGKYYAFYDGGSSMKMSGEETASLAESSDLRHFYPLSEKHPLFCSPTGTHSVRYIDAIRVGNKIFVYYEYSRPSGAHELRMNILPIEV